MKKKQIITLIIMMAVVVLLAAGYNIAKNMNKSNIEEDGQEEESNTIALFEINTDDVTGISYSCDLGSLEMTKEGGIWLQKDTEVPVDDENVSEMLEAVKEVVAIRVIDESTDNLGEFGLDNPSMQYTITMSDNTTYDFQFGLELQTQISGYYALINSQDKVYSVSSNYFEPFHKSVEEMIAIEDEINIDKDHVTKFGVTTDKGLNFAATYVGDEIEDSTYYTWRIDEPYDDVMADTDSLNEILANLVNLKYERCAGYDVEDMSRYGLDKPFATISVEYYEVTGVESGESDGSDDGTQEAQETEEDASTTPVPEEMRTYVTYILNIGNTYSEDEDTGYYVNPEGSSNVYKMDSTYLDALTGFTSFSLADPCIYTVLVDQLTGYEIEYEGEKIVVERKSDDEGQDVYYVNGKEVESEGILTLFSAAYLLTLTGEADDKIAEPDKDPVLKITYHTNGGKDDVVKYIPYDGNNFYQVDKNGMNYFLTDKRGIDDLISRYKTYMEENF